MAKCILCEMKETDHIYADYPVFEKSCIWLDRKTYRVGLVFRGVARFFACRECFESLARNSRKWEWFVKGAGFCILLLSGLFGVYMTVQRIRNDSPDSGFGHFYSPVIVGIFVVGYAFWRRTVAINRLASPNDSPKRVSELMKESVDKFVAKNDVPAENAFICITRHGEATSFQNSIGSKQDSEVVCGSFYTEIKFQNVGKISGEELHDKTLSAPPEFVTLYRTMGGDKDR